MLRIVKTTIVEFEPKTDKSENSTYEIAQSYIRSGYSDFGIFTGDVGKMEETYSLYTIISTYRYTEKISPEIKEKESRVFTRFLLQYRPKIMWF